LKKINSVVENALAFEKLKVLATVCQVVQRISTCDELEQMQLSFLSPTHSVET
jgi:hypothetical protein